MDFKNEENIKFLFITYSGRSGSTFFSNQLAKSTKEIVVMPEIKFLEILFAEGKLENLSFDKIFTLIKSDPRWINLKISDQELTTIITNTRDQGYYCLTVEIFQKFIENNNLNHPRYFAMKAGGKLLYFYNLLKSNFKNFAIINIVRDPRGVASSLMNSNHVYFNTGKKMGNNDPIRIAKNWQKDLRKVNKLRKENAPIYDVKFEDLCLEPTNVVSNLLLKLNIEPDWDESVTLKLAEREKSLHRLIFGSGDKNRVEAWKKELRKEHGLVIEMYLKKHINDFHFISGQNLIKANAVYLYYNLLYRLKLFSKYLKASINIINKRQYRYFGNRIKYFFKVNT